MKKNNILLLSFALLSSLLVSGCATQEQRKTQNVQRSTLGERCSNAGNLRDGSCRLQGLTERQLEQQTALQQQRRPQAQTALKSQQPPGKGSRRPSPSTASGYDSIWQRMASDLQFLPLTRHSGVEEMEDWYAAHPYYLTQVSKRASRYLHYILHQLELRGMPKDLALLPIVESAYDPLAYSHGRASGLWQFVPNTAKHMGLEQNWWYDGRRDVIAATDAALDYLTQLNKRFDGDWLLTLAAYNAGGGTVNKAIRRNARNGQPTDFWSLKLPKETKAYVPKFLALVKIYKNPASYKVNLPNIADSPHFAIIDTGSQLDLAQAAKLADITVDELYRLNPGFNRWMTSPDGPHRLLVPVASAVPFRQRLSQLPPEQRLKWQQYQVKKGDNLTKIARAHHIDVASLKANNDLKDNTLQVGQLLLIPDSREGRSVAAKGPGGTDLVKQQYTVSAGDTLGHIARRHGVSTKELARWNKLTSNAVIRPGQRLQLWVEQTGDQGIVRKLGYKVREGDSLARIANRFKIRVSDIVEWNQIDPGHYLRPGQSLTLYVDITRAGL